MYLEVIYFQGVNYSGRKLVHYPHEEAANIYKRTVKKLSVENKSCLIVLREDNHKLISSSLLNYEPLKNYRYLIKKKVN